MARQNAQQIVGTDIVDWLLFTQTLVHVVMEKELLVWYMDILERVDLAIAESGVIGLDAEVEQHYVLTFLEIVSSDNPDDSAKELRQHLKDTFCALFLATSDFAERRSLHGALAIAESIADYVRQAPAIIRIRLAERAMAFKYMTAPADAFLWLVEAGILPCAKFREADVNPRGDYRAAVLRIGLLCDLQWVRHYLKDVSFAKTMANWKFMQAAGSADEDYRPMLMEARDLWMAQHFDPREANIPGGFDHARQFDRQYVSGYLLQLHRHWNRPRFLTGSLAGWPSNIGAVAMMILKANEDPRPAFVADSAENQRNPAVRDNLALSAEAYVRRYGVTIHARSVYVRYRQLQGELVAHVSRYYFAVLNFGQLVPSAEWQDVIYLQLIDQVRKIEEGDAAEP